MNILQMDHIKKQFDDLEVLKDISLSVEEGEVLAIIGPSGSGKSTLIRCAAMLEQIDGGQISYLGHNAAWEEAGRVVYASGRQMLDIKANFGLVFQNFNLFPHFNVLKNVMDAPVRVQKRNKEEVYGEAMELLRKMGLDQRKDAYPCQLSGGQQQRVSIARALALKPKILFFDEPTSALDPELTAGILRVIRDLAADHMTMVIVTHEMEFAKNVADHFIFMEHGLIAASGAGDTIFDTDNTRMQEFLGRFH